MSNTLPSSVSGFTPIPVAYSSSCTHILYATAHKNKKKLTRKNKSSTLPDERTLFLVNVPPDATEREITQFFNPAGLVERVVFEGQGFDENTRVESENESDSEEIEEESESEGGSDDENHPRKKRKVTKESKPAAPEVKPIPFPTLRTYHKTGGTAHVIFLEPSSIARALSPLSKPRPWPSDSEAPSGLSHYKALYASLRPPLDVVKDHADSYMESYEYEQAKKKQKSKHKKGEAIVDEDGFTLVTRGGAYGKTVGGGVGIASKKFQNEARRGGSGKRSRKNKKEPQEKEDFYAFQVHEKKRKGGFPVLLRELY